MPKMTEDQFRSVIDQEVSQAAAWSNSVMAEDRERNLAYYYGMPMGNEVEGRSQVVSWDVFEVVESAMPVLLEPFFAGEDVGEFEPVGIEDEEYCEQATDYVNHLIKKKNDGFILFNTWVKDGLLSKIGIVRSWWDARRKVRKEEYTGITEEQLALWDQDESITIVSVSGTPDPDDVRHREQAQQALGTIPPEQAAQVQQMLAQPPKMLYDVELSVDSGPHGVCIDNVPPETFVLSRKAKRLKDATIIGELRRYTRSDLVEMGFDQARVLAMSDYDISSVASDLMVERDEDRNAFHDDAADPTLQELSLFFGFVRVDYDGDGIAEWRRVFMAGNDILENEEVDDHEYSIWSPILLPHRVIGMGYAEPAIEIQRLKTALTRQYLDSLYLANNPRTFAVEGVNLDDLLSTRIGGVVRMKQIGQAGPLQTTLVANESLQGIELADSMRENRIGVTRYNQGMDAESLNKTFGGLSKIMSAAERRVLMTLRIFAETGVKDLFKKVLKLTCTYQDKPATIKLRNKWVTYDPRNWSSEMDVTIHVGLGTGDRQETLQTLEQFGVFMDKAAPMGIVQPKNVYNFGKMLIKNARIQGGVENLITDPATVPPQPPQKSPEQVLAETELQMEQMRQQGKREEHTMKMQQARAELEANTTLKALDLQLKEKEIRIKEIDLGMRHQEMQHKQAMDVHHAAVEANRPQPGEFNGQ